MKKFLFTLQALYSVKETLEKQKKAELAKAREFLQNLLKIREDLLNSLRNNTDKYHEALTGVIDLDDVRRCSEYAEYLKGMLDEIGVEIKKAEEAALKIQGELIRVMREIQTLDKLRAEQYQNYLKEIAKEEEKELGDLMSYKSAMEDLEP